MNGENDEANHQGASEQSPPQSSSSQSESSPVTDNPAQQQQAGTEKKPNYERRHYCVQVTGVVIGLCVMAIYAFQLNEMRKSTNAATSAAKSAEKSLELGSKNLDLTTKTVELTQKNTELSQKNTELAQRSLEANQEAIKNASKANEISEKGMEIANTPWIDVSISDVSYKKSNSLEQTTGLLPPAYGILGASDAMGRISNNTVEISYSIQSHSDAPAPRVYSQCFLENAKGYMDREFSDTNIHAIMPHQPMSRRASLLATEGGDPKAVVNLINNGKVGVQVYVLFYGAMGKKSTFIETFYKLGGTFTRTNREINPSDAEIDKLIEDTMPIPKKKP